MHDVYDWDKNITEMGDLPVAPAELWELHHGGMAKNYEVYGVNTFTVTWQTGQRFNNGVVISNES